MEWNDYLFFTILLLSRGTEVDTGTRMSGVVIGEVVAEGEGKVKFLPKRSSLFREDADRIVAKWLFRSWLEDKT